jgi:hypothetical protein
MDEIKAISGGNAIRSTGDEGYEQTYTWNLFRDNCGDYTGDVYKIASMHLDIFGSVFLQIVSKKGRDNIGFNQGDNHMKCFYTNGAMQAKAN